MSSRRQVLPIFAAQLRQLLPAVRATGTTPLALLVLGLLWAGSVSLPRIAATLPLAACAPSRERRLRRWLANPEVAVVPLWRHLLPGLLADRAGQALVFVFDPTPVATRATILTLGLVVRHRVLPVAWRVVPQQDQPWPERQATYVRQMLKEVAAALPAGATATLLADRGVTSAGVIDACTAVGWHYGLRLNARPQQGCRIRDADRIIPLWELVTVPGQRWTGPVEVFRQAGWRPVELTIHWTRDAAAPWVLLSDEPGGPSRVRLYRRRMRAEATYQDCKRRGFDLARSKLTERGRLDRLLRALQLASWWGAQLGLRVIRRGLRHRYDRADRRDLSVLRLGRLWLADRLAAGQCPPLPFRATPTGWRFTWLARTVRERGGGPCGSRWCE
jgi:hypothetical protein